jgi:hypothetical protein
VGESGQACNSGMECGMQLSRCMSSRSARAGEDGEIAMRRVRFSGVGFPTSLCCSTSAEARRGFSVFARQQPWSARHRPASPQQRLRIGTVAR